MKRIAWFVSPHGFGHAARSAAVIAALQQRSPGTQSHIFTRVPRWFFADSLPAGFGYEPLLTDVGLVQKSALHEDVDATLRRLRRFLSTASRRASETARRLRSLRCDVAVCDISPLGLMAARAAGIPSVLVENFTWDWIYEAYEERRVEFLNPIHRFAEAFAMADVHIQTEPVCRRRPCALTAPPVSRAPRLPPDAVRARLAARPGVPVVMLTMGGIRDRLNGLDKLRDRGDVLFVAPGAAPRRETRGNVVLLPHRSGHYHPDLVHAADLVVGKLGYSTIAEIYHAGIPFAYVPRPRFRESGTLAAFADRHLRARAIRPESFADGGGMDTAMELLGAPRIRRRGPNGADVIAGFLLANLC